MLEKKRIFQVFSQKYNFHTLWEHFILFKINDFCHFPLLEALLKILNMIISCSMLKPGRQSDCGKFQLSRANNWYRTCTGTGTAEFFPTEEYGHYRTMVFSKKELSYAPTICSFPVWKTLKRNKMCWFSTKRNSVTPLHFADSRCGKRWKRIPKCVGFQFL